MNELLGWIIEETKSANFGDKMKLITPIVRHQLFGFALSGSLSTVFMFGLYVLLNDYIYYQYAYLISYSMSVIALYFMNIIVFKRPISIDTFLAFPLIYLLQYLIGAVALEFIVRFGFSIAFAPLWVAILLVPLTFLLNRIIFSRQ